MKKIIVIMVFFVFLTLIQSVYAHPPRGINITFDPKTKTLNVVISHDVSDPLRHYIKRVDIGLNGKEVSQVSFSRQDNVFNQTVTYIIPDAKEGDTLSVEAYCSMYGKLEKEITVSGA